MAAKEIKRKFNIAHRQVVIEVQDEFGHVSTHSIPLLSDHCEHCGQALPGTNGTADVNATALATVAHVDSLMDDLIQKLEVAANGDQELLKVVQAAKAKRNGNPPSSQG